MSSMAIDRRHLPDRHGAHHCGGERLARLCRHARRRRRASGVAAGDLIAACRRPDGNYSVVVLTLDGTILRELPLEGRGHDIALDRRQRHRPSSSRAGPVRSRSLSTSTTAREPVLFTTPANRHFYGHGVFSRDGRLLYATEHDNETRDGLIGVYNATAGYQAHRRDPDLRHRPARGDPAGGRQDARRRQRRHRNAHRDGPREAQPRSSMQPSLAFIDSSNGRLISQHKQSSDSAQAVDPPPGAGRARRRLVRLPVGRRRRRDARARRLRRPRPAAAHHRAGKAHGRFARRLHRRRGDERRWPDARRFGAARGPHRLRRHRTRSRSSARRT